MHVVALLMLVNYSFWNGRKPMWHNENTTSLNHLKAGQSK